MNKQTKKLLSVTDLSAYLYCPRKFYLQKIVGIKMPPTKVMIEGKIRHEILEAFANKEEIIVSNFQEKSEHQKIVSVFQQALQNLVNQNFVRNKNQIYAFKIEPETLQLKILNSMNKDIILRAEAILKSMENGFLGNKLWENLKPKYISEFPLLSETIGLKGRADRVMIYDDTIIPFELKTRPVKDIYDSDKIQLSAYALLLEEHFQKPVNLGILEAGNEKFEMQITKEMKQKVLDLIEEVNNLSDNPKFPSNFSKCQSCDFQQDCDELGESEE